MIAFVTFFFIIAMVMAMCAMHVAMGDFFVGGGAHVGDGQREAQRDGDADGKEGKSKKAAAKAGGPKISWKGNLGHVSIDNDWSAIAVRPGKTPFFEVRQRAVRPSAQARAKASTVRR